MKQVGSSGQISLSKEFAGRTVLIENPEPGVRVIKTAQSIPDSELWLHRQEAAVRPDGAMAAMHQLPEDADLDALEHHLDIHWVGHRIKGDRQQGRSYGVGDDEEPRVASGPVDRSPPDEELSSSLTLISAAAHRAAADQLNVCPMST